MDEHPYNQMIHRLCIFCACVPGVLVGNKSDLSARREVQASVAQEWAQSQGLEYHETSAVSVFQYGNCVLVSCLALCVKCTKWVVLYLCTSTTSLCLLQKEMENCDAPLLSLARAFHSLYQERREAIQNLSPG